MDADTESTSDHLPLLAPLRIVFQGLGEKRMKPLKILTGEEAVAAVHALNDESRRRILYALKARRMSTSELVDFLSRQNPDREFKPQTVRYHVKELERSGLIQQDGYEPAGNGDTHIMKKVWRATAENIFIATENLTALPSRRPTDVDSALNIIQVMKELGFAIPDDATIDLIAKRFVEWDQLWRKGRVNAEKTLAGVTAIDPDVYVSLRRILSLLNLNDSDYDRYWEVSRMVTDAFRKAYKEGLAKNPEVY